MEFPSRVKLFFITPGRSITQRVRARRQRGDVAVISASCKLYIFFHSFLRFSDKVGFSPVSQALGSRSHPGAVPQEKREEGDGGKRDSGYQETLGQNGLQRPPQFQDHGKGGALLHSNV